MRVLIVDDDLGLCEGLGEFLSRNFKVEIAFSGSQALDSAARHAPDCILLDWCLPDTSGLDMIPRLRRICRAPIVMLSAVKDPQNVVNSLRAGATNFLFKPVKNDDLLQAVRSVVETAPGAGVAASASSSRFLRLPSPAMGEIYHKLERVSKFTDKTVLIYGETGTGKEHLVHLLHELSGPPGRPLVEINCGAVPESLFESELFGHEAGAFTDARQRRTGVLEMAEGGTAFFDEVGELPLGLQSKLLKVIEERKIRRLGGSKDVPLNLRIVAATNRDLAREVEAGRFRRDLYYRLNGYTILVPPLQQRGQDLPVLAEFFYRDACGNAGVAPERLNQAFLESLSRHPWPGNVRELKNFIYSEFIDGSLGTNSGPRPGYDVPSGAGAPLALTALPSRRQTHLKTVLEVLKRHAGNKTRAAAELGITRQTLGKWIKEEEAA
ncbi:MAG TPA: sigma-54 dependent transcriptional regulator [bacterium]|jgi:DNA-binding NtrC family response regulator|nr:sigma-54 dependent transcriptional regulator [bacterium]